MGTIKNVTDSDFEQQVLNAEGTVIVDFWAEWCGPCKQIAPILEDLANENPNLTIVKLNIDESPTTPSKYGVRGIPTLIAFRNGEAVATKIGAVPRGALSQWITSATA